MAPEHDSRNSPQEPPYLSTGAGTDPFSGLGPSLRQMIADGTMVWLTALVEDENGGPTTVAMGAAWDAMYPNPNIPVITEGDVGMLTSYFMTQCMPSAYVVDPDMNIFGIDDCMTWNQLQALVDTFGGG